MYLFVSGEAWRAVGLEGDENPVQENAGGDTGEFPAADPNSYFRQDTLVGRSKCCQRELERYCRYNATRCLRPEPQPDSFRRLRNILPASQSKAFIFCYLQAGWGAVNGIKLSTLVIELHRC